ncbi:DUF6641 family protein [Polynucleobacter sp. JS-Fieb-80-E5]|uniref:DUF6641 family protein n=1 Tax=Polynucleobacter sp. JS-Fieb-80-E5 TaxID=2081050 RepID=UPI001C0CB854|nr:DUF6641 family protein [Polynucleobacter sp. JS-Fieb-80-E5]MBU3618799.1 hypothetical protein [Polynucleobacter sp. JS-Fieb-80-E5]
MGTSNALSHLQFVDAVRPRSIPAVQLRRNKLSNKLWEQIQLAKSQLEHTHFIIKRRVTVKDLEGNYKKIERPKRIKPWWYMAMNGSLCLSVFYGSKRIEIIPGKTSINVANMTDLITTLELLKFETEKGSLDGAIEIASSALKLNFNKNR